MCLFIDSPCFSDQEQIGWPLASFSRPQSWKLPPGSAGPAFGGKTKGTPIKVTVVIIMEIIMKVFVIS